MFTTFTHSSRRSAAERLNLLSRTIETLLTWLERARGRRILAEMNESMRRDIGVDRARVDEEARKPFWRA